MYSLTCCLPYVRVNIRHYFWFGQITGGRQCCVFPVLTVAVCLCVPQEKVIPCLLRLKQASDPGLRAAVREALALVGYQTPVKGRGIRILSIDGGGLRYKFNSSSYLCCKIWETDVHLWETLTTYLESKVVVKKINCCFLTIIILQLIPIVVTLCSLSCTVFSLFMAFCLCLFLLSEDSLHFRRYTSWKPWPENPFTNSSIISVVSAQVRCPPAPVFVHVCECVWIMRAECEIADWLHWLHTDPFVEVLLFWLQFSVQISLSKSGVLALK